VVEGPRRHGPNSIKEKSHQQGNAKSKNISCPSCLPDGVLVSNPTTEAAKGTVAIPQFPQLKLASMAK